MMKIIKTKLITTLIILLVFFTIQDLFSKNNQKVGGSKAITEEIIKAEKSRVLGLADSFLLQKPITVTATSSSRSAGGVHDFYSEATYWWPNPADPNGPYVQNDGVNNPDNFDSHRQAIARFSWIVGTETSAYLLSGDRKYADHAILHLKAWFTDSTTLMHPHLLYAQAIKGLNTGRGIGIVDAVSLIEVTKAVAILEKSPYLSKEESKIVKEWFRSFMVWLNTHPYGIDEMNAKNNHGTWWHTQVAAYAQFVGDEAILEKCRTHYKEILLPNQMAMDGSYPRELARTKPYSYSLFNLDGMATLAFILSDITFDGWNFQLPNGCDMNKGVAFIKPYLLDIRKWSYKKDIAHWDELPGRRPFMFFAAMKQNQTEWVLIWKNNSPDFPSDESSRNMPLKNPVLWLGITRPIQ